MKLLFQMTSYNEWMNFFFNFKSSISFIFLLFLLLTSRFKLFFFKDISHDKCKYIITITTIVFQLQKINCNLLNFNLNYIVLVHYCCCCVFLLCYSFWCECVACMKEPILFYYQATNYVKYYRVMSFNITLEIVSLSISIKRKNLNCYFNKKNKNK